MGNTAKKFLDLLFKYPFVYLAIAIIFTVLTFVSVTELKEDFTYRIFFEKTDPNLLELEQFEKLQIEFEKLKDWKDGAQKVIWLIATAAGGMWVKHFMDLMMK